ncbi:MAG TPA: S8 family serine peptidase [Candidatus Limnocylindria bacterium]
MRDAVQREPPLKTERPVAATLAAALVLTCLLGEPSPAVAGSPKAESAAEFMARERGGRASDYAVVYQRAGQLSTGEPVWAAKVVDRRSGAVSLVYRDQAGVVGGPELVRGHERAAAARLSAVERKASPALQRALRAGLSRRAVGGVSAPRLAVAVWLDADVAGAQLAVQARHPEVSWLAGRPLANELATIRAVRGELWAARRDAYAAAAEALHAEVRRLGGRVAYASTSAPVVFLDLPATGVAPMAQRDDVVSLGLEGAWSPAMSTAGKSVDANWTAGGGDRGTGVRVAVVEYHNVRRGGDMSGTVVKSHSTTGKLAFSGGFDHPTWVAGAIAGQGGKWKGVAPGAGIVSSGTGGYRASLAYDRRIIAAADWAIAPGGGNADIVNTSLVQDTSTGAEEGRRYFDAVADQDGRLAISAAGNYVNFGGWQIGSPGTGYNVLTVGGVDDRGTSRRADDRIWYVPGSNGSNWLDRPGDPWNRHGDYNKPNLLAPAVGVRTANGLAASGTSVATPIVAGVAAQLLANEPVLAAWPEGARAVLMAGAIHRVKMPNGSRNVDHEGVGMTSAYWTNLIAQQGDNQFGGYVIGALSPGQEPTQQISVRAGDRLRVALAWNSHTSGSDNLSKTDVLRADLDLRVIGPDGADVGSYTIDNAYEFVELSMPSTGTATIEVRQSRFDGPSETYGLAWAKVRDSTPPRVTGRSPGADAKSVSQSATVRATFSEQVVGADDSNVSLIALANGHRVGALVTYKASTRTAVLRPDQDLAPGWYEARLRGRITDRAGNRLGTRTWQFRVVSGA